MKRAGVITILVALVAVLSVGDQAEAGRRCCKVRRVRHNHGSRASVQCCTPSVSSCDPCGAVCDPCGSSAGSVAPAMGTQPAPAPAPEAAPAPTPTEEIPPPPDASASNPTEAKLPAYL